MKSKKFLKGFGLALILATGLFLMTYVTISAADECKIVRIISTVTYQEVSLDPKILEVDKGTCVIWFNKASKSQVEIAFEEGKKVCEDVVEASVDFKLDEKNCFITTTHIPPFGTASLVFKKEGTYDYVAQVQGTSTKVKGQIKVK
jgi:hypothetical protein